MPELYQHMLIDIVNKTDSLKEVDRFLFYEGEREAGEYFMELFPALPHYQQDGKDLGARMEAAFIRAFAMGYQAAAIIGTDSPDLPVSHIEEAFRILEQDGIDVVFGPAEDGGYYLLAMKRLHNVMFGISRRNGQALRDSAGKESVGGLRPFPCLARCGHH
jgi:glycosyltransferase A (GT-A) superfamily protein (DUF2064 family)